MARTPDLERRQELLDRIVVYLAENGLAQATLRPMAAALDVSINRLVHHFGAKEELITAALNRAIEQQLDVQRAWMRRAPNMTVVEFYRRWWKWMIAKPDHLALVRLNYEAAALDPSVTGLTGDVRADQIGVWRHEIEERLLAEGVPPERVEVEAGLTKATFSGLIMDLIATGDRKRLTVACEEWLGRLSVMIRTHAEPPPAGAVTAGSANH
jgi:AcrR family transcriptional regulator